MANLDDFKQIVDENLQDLDISPQAKRSLKNKAEKPQKKWNTQFIKLAVPAMALVLVGALALSGIFRPLTVSASENLMESITAKSAASLEADQRFISATADFSVELLKQSLSDDKNMLISPLSACFALGMTANGAKENTLTQFEAVLGGGIEISALNGYYWGLSKRLQQNSDIVKIANSIWYKSGDDITVSNDFLQKNADYYGSDAYQLDFSDAETVNKINNWVKENTDGLIDKMVDKIDEDTIMYLINTLLFEAEWETEYKSTNLYNNLFHAPNGDVEVEYMNGSENTYLEDDSATGFIKKYKDCDYSFAAILPNTDADDYISGLTGEKFLSLINSQTQQKVITSMPRFKYSYEIKLNDALQNLGLTDAFSVDYADFSGMAKSNKGENVFIGNVLQKTYIEVGPLGTKAGAATVVEMMCDSAMPADEIKYVTLDRPFVYAIIDNATGLPLFIGCVNNPSAQ